MRTLTTILLMFLGLALFGQGSTMGLNNNTVTIDGNGTLTADTIVAKCIYDLTKAHGFFAFEDLICN
jgi:hypothetical protein